MGQVFQPITSSNFSDERWVRRKRQPFNDTRLYKVWTQMTDLMQASQSIVVNVIAKGRAQAATFYNFLSNKRVQIEELVKMSCEVKPSAQTGRHILVLGDTTSFSLKSHMGRIQDTGKIGVLEDNKTPGFFAHAHLAVDAGRGDILGLADLLLWNREKSEGRPATATGYVEKESFKWYLGARNALETLPYAEKATFVLDRDADSYELFSLLYRMRPGTGFVVRLHHDRKVLWEGQTLSITEVLSKTGALGQYETDLPALDHYSSTNGKRIKRKARRATLELRSAKISLLAPSGKKTVGPAQHLPLWLVEAREVLDGPLPDGEEPVLWRILTTDTAGTFEQALQIVRFYTMRWIIEQLFRTIKSEGFALESTELETFDAILRQTVMAFQAATKVLQLVYARNRYDSQPLEEVFDEQEQSVLKKLNHEFQGTTDTQRNPFPENQVSWATWIIARLGGWKGYISQKPPGPITLKKGLEKFAVFVKAFEMFNTS